MDRSDAAGVKQRLAVALTIAGSDSGGGAGIQADLKTFAALGVHGASVVTALTAQNTRGVRAIHYPPPAIVAAQIEAVLEDFVVAAIKIGMLGSPEIVGAVAEALDSPRPARGERVGARAGRSAGFLLRPLIRPSGPPSPRGRREGALRATVSVRGRRPSSSTIRSWSLRPGEALSGAGFVEAVRRELLPLVDCLTPNLAEAAVLLGEKVAGSEADMVRQGAALLKLGPRAVLMKGGHLDGERGGRLPRDCGRRSPLRRAAHRLAQSARDRLHAVERHRRPCRARDGVAGSRGGGQGVRRRSDREGSRGQARRRETAL